MNFDEIVKRAGEVKQAQMRDKRRNWEATAEFVKNTIAHDASEAYAKIRSTSSSVREKIDFATAPKDAGNVLFAKGRYTQAMTKYTEAVAVFRYWVRQMNGKDQELICHRDDEALRGTEKTSVQTFLAAVYLNAAACLLRNKQMATHPEDVVWICTEVVAMHPGSAKAYYRRAMAFVEMNSSASLELAVRDLRRAAKLAPGDADVRAALSKHGAAYAAQHVKDKHTYGGMFNTRDGLYTETERSTMSAPAGPAEPTPAETLFPDGLSETELKQRALAAGLDLEDPFVLRKLDARARARHEESLRAKAKELDIDLDDPDVRKALELMDAETKRRELGMAAPAPASTWRRCIARAFDKKQIINVPNVLYTYLAVRHGVSLLRSVSFRILRIYKYKQRS